jgi:CDP-4-dehydro-6-deoxyglucose reductase
VIIECHEVNELNSFPVKTIKFRVQKMERATQNVMLLELRPEGDEQMNFIAGQYVAVQLDDGTKRSYSISNAPHESDHLQLQICLVKGGKFTSHVFDGMKEGDVLQVEGPLGTFFLHEESDKPIIFMSGNTGFASIKSMVEHAFKVGLNRSMVLYWGARTPADFYLADLAKKWQQEHDNFKFIPVLSEPKPEHDWHGRTGLVTEAILQDYQDLSNYQIYACGPPLMVDAGRAPFVAKGLPEEQYFTDAFLSSSHIISVAAAPAKGLAHD